MTDFSEFAFVIKGFLILPTSRADVKAFLEQMVSQVFSST